MDNKTSVRFSNVGGLDSGISAFCCMDKGLDFFENQYRVPDGMSYDSYVVIDDKITVMDTVDQSVADKWLEALEKFLEGRIPHYLVVQHLEPDHSAGIELFLKKYPSCRIICSARAAAMLPHFLPEGFETEPIVVKDGEKISIGSREIQFIYAPMVHWPEVMVSYIAESRVLFSADAFGTFGTSIVDSYAEAEDFDAWLPEARRYYINICGKYGAQVHAVLTKVAALDVDYVCPLHGPVLHSSAGKALAYYEKWSLYEPDSNAVFIAAASLHGATHEAARRLASMLEAKGVHAIVADLTRSDMAECVAQAFACPATVFASATYDSGIMPLMDGIGRAHV